MGGMDKTDANAWRCARPRARSPQRAPGTHARIRPPSCEGRGSALRALAVADHRISRAPRHPHAWRCARPRARSPERATGTHAHIRPPSARAGDRRFAPWRWRTTASPGLLAIPTPGDAPVPGRGARNGRPEPTHTSDRPARAEDAGGTPALPGPIPRRRLRERLTEQRRGMRIRPIGHRDAPGIVGTPAADLHREAARCRSPAAGRLGAQLH
jgi:hypothetical protein